MKMLDLSLLEKQINEKGRVLVT